MSRRGGRFVDLIERTALRWTVRYTDGLPLELRATRRAEVASDLHEHRAAFAARGIPPGRIALSVLARLIRGVPADLAWRRQRLTSSAPAAPTTERRRTPMSTRKPAEQKPWRPLPEAHQFNQLNDVVDVTDENVSTDAGEDDRVVARNAANIAAGISAGGLQ